MKKAVILARVSTQQQEFERQINELTEFANRMNIQIVKVFSNKISGAKKTKNVPKSRN